MYDQYEKFYQLKKHIKERDIKAVRLTCKNNLKTLVSRHTLKKTGQVHSKTEVEVNTVHFPINSLKYRLNMFQQESLWANKYENSDNYLRVYYEDLLYGYNKEMEDVLLFLVLDKKQKLSLALKKIAPDSLGLIIENYTEVEKELIGSIN